MNYIKTPPITFTERVIDSGSIWELVQVTITREDLKLWKRKLLRALAPSTIGNPDKLYLISGLCNLVREAARNSANGTGLPMHTELHLIDSLTNSFTSFQRYSGHGSFPILVKLTRAERNTLATQIKAGYDRSRYPSRYPIVTDHPGNQYVASKYCTWLGPFRRERIALLNHWIARIPAEGIVTKYTRTTSYVGNLISTTVLNP